MKTFLQKLQTEFVERFDRQQVVLDARRITEVAKRNQAPFFFAEGTFKRVAGLLDFHLGAFITAAQSEVPVVPIAIRGSRAILRDGSWFPHHGQITLTIGEALDRQTLRLAQDTDNWRVALQLRDAARKHILRYCGEPDLAQAK